VGKRFGLIRGFGVTREADGRAKYRTVALLGAHSPDGESGSIAKALDMVNDGFGCGGWGRKGAVQTVCEE
jgi:hypothetical protein